MSPKMSPESYLKLPALKRKEKDTNHHAKNTPVTKVRIIGTKRLLFLSLMKSAAADIIFAALLIEENKQSTNNTKRPANTQDMIAPTL